MEFSRALLKAGQIASEVRKLIESKSLVGMSLLEVCKLVEGEIRKRGGEPAFPCCVGVNSVAAHYTSMPGEEVVVREGDVVKVDLGVHVEGYIADTAVTLCYNPDYDDLTEATKAALSEALKFLRDGVNLGEVGRVVGQLAEKKGFKTITNLSGHLMEPYTVHAGKSIPNIWVQTCDVAKEGEVYAVEPFLTTKSAGGYVVDSKHKAIYSIVSRRRTGDKVFDFLVDKIWSERRSLPFTPRWYSDLMEGRLLQRALEKLVSKKVLKVYPALVEARGGFVAQFEHTVVIFKEGVRIIT